MENINKIALDLIKKHEGFRQFPYRCTEGKLTIGYGLNIEDRGITEKQASYLLEDEVKEYPEQLRSIIINYYGLSETRQAVLIDMLYNLGITRLSKFNNMILAIVKKDFDLAADEMLDSKWARRLKGRAIELSNIMRTNKL